MKDRNRIKELQEDWNKVVTLFHTLWNERQIYIKYSLIAMLLSIVYVFSVPKRYMTSVLLAPETSNGSISSGLASMASMANINIPGMGEDALAVDLYPTIVSSKDFLSQLFNVRVKSSDLEVDTTYSAYLSLHQKSPWWNYPKQILGVTLKKMLPRKNIVCSSNTSESLVKRLSEDEMELCEAMRGRIICSVEDLTGVLMVSVIDQDAEISAVMADTVVNCLNRFIQDYRTHKARTDYAYIKALCDSARKEYLDLQSTYTTFLASHSDIYSPKIKAQAEYLNNESQLAYMAYSQYKSQLQAAHAKVQECTPVYTVIESSYVPYRAISPKKLLTVIGFIILACLCATIKLFYKYFLQKDAQD